MTHEDEAVRRLRDAVARLREETSARPPTNRSHDDADDTVGTVATDDAVGFDPLPLLRTLDRHGAEAVVMGQVAGIMHGSGELTGEIRTRSEPRQRHSLRRGAGASGRCSGATGAGTTRR